MYVGNSRNGYCWHFALALGFRRSAFGFGNSVKGFAASVVGVRGVQI
jgi:hypothetical protein